jgi:hypothetical protein
MGLEEVPMLTPGKLSCNWSQLRRLGSSTPYSYEQEYSWPNALQHKWFTSAYTQTHHLVSNLFWCLNPQHACQVACAYQTQMATSEDGRYMKTKQNGNRPWKLFVFQTNEIIWIMQMPNIYFQNRNLKQYTELNMDLRCLPAMEKHHWSYDKPKRQFFNRPSNWYILKNLLTSIFKFVDYIKLFITKIFYKGWLLTISAES